MKQGSITFNFDTNAEHKGTLGALADDINNYIQDHIKYDGQGTFEGLVIKNVKYVETLSSNTTDKIIKPFASVKPGDQGQDYGDTKGTVIDTGGLEELREYDSTGACEDMDTELVEWEMVAVKPDDHAQLLNVEGTLLYVYGPDGFYVEVENGE